MSAADLVEMTEEEEVALEAAIADPSTITSHDYAVEVLAQLEHDIAEITAQLEAARVEAAVAELPPHRQEWVRRAAYARSMKQAQHHRVLQRDRELRNVVFRHHKDPGEGVARQQRLQAEAEARKAARLAEAERLASARAQEAAAAADRAQTEIRRTIKAMREAVSAEERARTFYGQFFTTARERLDEPTFVAIRDEANARLAAAGLEERHA